MDLTAINEVLGLASSAVGLTGKAAATFTAIKGILDKEVTPDAREASKLLNELATELTMANVTNVNLSQALKALSQELQRQDDFEREKARYELYQTDGGSVVYRLRDEMSDGQPEHLICPVCLNRDRLISYLHGRGEYRRCQTDSKHVFQFSISPPKPRRISGDF